LDTQSPSLLANKLLATLPTADFKLLTDHLVIVSMAQGTVLFETDDEIDQIVFPLRGMVSLLVVLRNGNAVETATVGREGSSARWQGGGSINRE
jgi:CRP-like cAMP-binding protein